MNERIVMQIKNKTNITLIPLISLPLPNKVHRLSEPTTSLHSCGIPMALLLGTGWQL